jgi:hypothetical protein
MKNKTKVIVFSVIALCLLATGFGIVKAAYGPNDSMGGLVSAVAKKFNLSETDVQSVVSEYRTQNQAQRQAEMQQRFTERINQAVTDGKLTQAQANLIIAKKAELEAKNQELQGKTGEERKEAMQGIMTELKQWMTDNNIPQQFFSMGFDKGQGGRGGRGGGQGCPMFPGN